MDVPVHGAAHGHGTRAVPVHGVAAVHFMVVTTVLDTVVVPIEFTEAYAAMDMVAVHVPEVLTARLRMLDIALHSLGIVVNGTSQQSVIRDMAVRAVSNSLLLRRTSSL